MTVSGDELATGLLKPRISSRSSSSSDPSLSELRTCSCPFFIHLRDEVGMAVRVEPKLVCIAEAFEVEVDGLTGGFEAR